MANYINTQTTAYPVTQQEIEREFPNTSFPVPFVAPEPYSPVLNSPIPEYNSMTQGYKEVSPVEESGNWMQQFEVYDLTPEQIQQNKDNAKAANKQQASSLLSATDWTATVDISNPQYSNPYLTNQDAFLSYRSQVRAIAVNPPVTVSEWPVLPSEAWSS